MKKNKLHPINSLHTAFKAKYEVYKCDFISVEKIKSILQESGFTIGTIQRVDTAIFIPSIYMVVGYKDRKAQKIIMRVVPNLKIDSLHNK